MTKAKIDIRPTCIQCGRRWMPKEGIDATEDPCDKCRLGLVVENAAPPRRAKVHDVKTWPTPFEATWRGDKPYEVREADRDYTIGDWLLSREWDPALRGYTGRAILAVILFVTPPEAWGLPKSICVMGLRVVSKARSRAEGELPF